VASISTRGERILGLGLTLTLTLAGGKRFVLTHLKIVITCGDLKPRIVAKICVLGDITVSWCGRINFQVLTII
jgi:hypothetical protein